jgi:hypothetical protein
MKKKETNSRAKRNKRKFKIVKMSRIGVTKKGKIAKMIRRFSRVRITKTSRRYSW